MNYHDAWWHLLWDNLFCVVSCFSKLPPHYRMSLVFRSITCGLVFYPWNFVCWHCALVPCESSVGNLEYGIQYGNLRYYNYFTAGQNVNTSFLSPYLESLGSTFSNGANFAIVGSSTLPRYVPFALNVQIMQFLRFKSRSLELVTAGTHSNFF